MDGIKQDVPKVKTASEQIRERLKVREESVEQDRKLIALWDEQPIYEDRFNEMMLLRGLLYGSELR